MEYRIGIGMLSFLLFILTFMLSPCLSFGENAEFPVFKIKIDTAPLHQRNGSGPTRDIYIRGGEAAGLRETMLLNVFRDKTVQDPNNGEPFEVSIAIGQIEVMELFENVAIARTVALTSSEDATVLRYHTVMTGDYAVPIIKAVNKKKVRVHSRINNRTQIENVVLLHRPAVLLPSGLLFRRDDWKLKEEARGMLSTIDGIFNKSKGKTIIVAGHTCSLGPEKYNLELSRKRAKSVAAYLMQTKGIPNDNIRIEYYGEKLPLALNDTEEGRSRNRRVEISFLSHEINYF